MDQPRKDETEQKEEEEEDDQIFLLSGNLCNLIATRTPMHYQL